MRRLKLLEPRQRFVEPAFPHEVARAGGQGQCLAFGLELLLKPADDVFRCAKLAQLVDFGCPPHPDPPG